MKKKPLITVGIVLASLGLIVGVFASVCSIFYHESFMAGVTNIYLILTKRGEKFNNPEIARKTLEEKETINSQRLDTPKSKKGITIEEDLVSTNGLEGIQAFIYNNQDNPENTVFYFHGGAYINQPNNQQYTMSINTSYNTNCELILICYPKAPIYNCEQSIETSYQYYLNYLANNEVGKVSFMGDSAGGHLALAVAEHINEKNKKDLLPEELILISPVVDNTGAFIEEMKQILPSDPMLGIDGLEVISEAFLDGMDKNDYRASPLYYDKLADLKNVKVTLFGATRDILKTNSDALNNKLIEKGFDVDYTIGEGLIHCYVICPIPEAKESLEKVYKAVTR